MRAPVAHETDEVGEPRDRTLAPTMSQRTRRSQLFEWGVDNRVPVQAILFTVALVVAVYLGGKLVYKLRGILLLLVVSGFIALVLNPAVVRLQGFGRLGLRRRGVAVGVVMLGATVVFLGLLGLFGYPLVNGITHFADHLPSYVKQAENGKGPFGHLVRKYHVEAWVKKNAPKLASSAKNFAKPALSIGKGAATLLLDLFVTFMLIILWSLEGPKMRVAILGMMSPGRARRLTKVAGDVSRSVNGFMIGKAVLSLAAGAVTLVTLQVMAAPFALLLALWVGVVDFLPMIGGFIAFVPVVLIVWAERGGVDAIVYTIVFAAYWFTENHVLNPIVMSRTVKMNPLLVLVAVLMGAAVGDLVGGIFGGFVGTLVAIPLAGSIQVVVRELWQVTDRSRAQ